MLVNDKEQKIKEAIQEITGQETDINKNVCYEDIKNYREYHINKILLLCSSFDYFLLEEEGRLNALFSEWCSFTDKIQPPIINHIEESKEALNKVRKENYDLIIIFNKPKDSRSESVADNIKKVRDVPVVLLCNDVSELSKIKNKKTSKIDYFFTWNGDGKSVISIVHYLEDKKNLEYTNKDDRKDIIFLVEDSIQHYSTYIQLIYEEICNHLKKVMNDELSCEQKIQRFKRRPYVLHSEYYNETLGFYNEYKKDLLIIISDNFLEYKNPKKQIGVKLANKIAEDKINIPVLIQSSEKIDKTKLANKNIKFVLKTSHKLIIKIRNFIKDNFGPYKITFYKENGSKFEVTKLKELQYAFENQTVGSIVRCARKNDISRFLNAIGEKEFSQKCYEAEQNIADGERLQKRFIELMEDYNYQINQAAVTSFSPRLGDPFVKITRIGKGALGGKARGLAFLAKIISKYISEDKFPNLKITIPRSIVLSTDVFDKFMEKNNFSDIDYSNLSDERISSKFMKASLPATVLGDLRSFIRNTRKPVIVRSSGLLEDSMMQPFAGVYASMVLPNESWETDLRFHEVTNSIKYVYASTYFEQSRGYIKSTPKHIGDEKMAVLIQELVGEKHDGYFYPTISGVAKSYNYYPQGPCKPQEGIVYLALGLGKAIVDGGASFAFCPEKPKAPLFGTPKDFIKYSQTSFYALNLKSIYKFVNYNEETSLDKLDLNTAKKHGVLNKIVSTYISEDDSLYPGIYDGSLVVDFAPILKYNYLPLAKAVKLLLNISEIALGYPVEIEFAVNISKDENKPSDLVILQIRNMLTPEKDVNVDFEKISRDNTIICSKDVLGNGILENVYDVVYVDQENFDLSKSNEVISQIKKMNNHLSDEHTPYILIGPGRWGSSDPWLGIPVIWSDIAAVRAIIETPYKERPIDPSQGSHFFHDMTAAQVVYMITKKQDDVDWRWIKKQKIIDETKYIKHIKTNAPLQIIVDGKKGKGAVIRNNIENIPSSESK